MTGLSKSQRDFLDFHVKRLVEHWQWLLQDSNLRAHYRKRSATIARRELDDLIARGLMFKGAGIADVHATDAGRALITEDVI